MGGRGTSSCWMGFDLGATKMLAAVFDRRLRQLSQKRRSTEAAAGKREGLARMLQTAREAMDKAGVKPEALAGIGIGSPGPLDLNKGRMLNPPNMAWGEVRLKDTFEKAFGCPTVVLNDVDAGVYGEYRFGAGRGARCVVGLFPGTGIGGGCVYEGRILRGAVYSCMEIGHLPVLPGGPLCGCGKQGCLEAVASRLAVSAALAVAAHRGDAPHLMERAGTDLRQMRSSDIAAAIAAGDKVVERIVRDAARWLGVGVAAAVNLLAPDVVVLGGGLVEALPALYVEEVEASARARVMPVFEKTFAVAAARLGNEATSAGAAAWAADVVGGGGRRPG